MTAAAACAVQDAAHLLDLELAAAALTAEALGSSPDYYHPAIQAAKHHPGQAGVAAALRALLAGSGAAPPLRAMRRALEAAEAAAAAAHDVVPAGVSIQRQAQRGRQRRTCPCVLAGLRASAPSGAAPPTRLPCLACAACPAAAPTRCAASLRAWGPWRRGWRRHARWWSGRPTR